jgi:hypothetical protein
MLSEQPDDYRDLVQRLSALQLNLSEGEQNLIRQRRTLHSLKALIPSNNPTQSDNQPTLQELGSRIADLTSKLDLSWGSHLNTKEHNEEAGNEESGSRGEDLVVRWLFALAGASRSLEEGDCPSTLQTVGETGPADRRRVRKSVAASVSRLGCFDAPVEPN